MIAMIRAAAQTWMDANPRLRLIYDGVTTEEPYDGLTGDGNNVIGWGQTRPGSAAAHLSPSDKGPTYTGFGIVLSHTAGWSWEPCDPPAGKPCTAERDGESGDFQGVVVHEWGHILGLEHPCIEQGDCDDPNDHDEMTMHTDRPYRIRQTLALGDILGVRALYPTDASMPSIYWP